MKTMEYGGQEALDAIGKHLVLLDGRLSGLALQAEQGWNARVTLTVVPRESSDVAEASISVASATRFEAYWDGEDEDFYLIEGYKAFITAKGRVYVSLDPYDYRSLEVDERDRFVIEGGSVSVRLRVKE